MTEADPPLRPELRAAAWFGLILPALALAWAIAATCAVTAAAVAVSGWLEGVCHG